MQPSKEQNIIACKHWLHGGEVQVYWQSRDGFFDGWSDVTPTMEDFDGYYNFYRIKPLEGEECISKDHFEMDTNNE